MKFDSLGYPAINGAFVDGKDNFEDSPHMAGILALFNHPQAVNMMKYVFSTPDNKIIYKRHPDSKYDMSRDNAIPLMAGLWAQGKADLINLDYVDGKDVMPPSVHGMVRAAKGKKPFFWQTWDFDAELEVNYTIQKLEEPFQIIAMCKVYGGTYLKKWTERNPLWRWAIRRYLCELDGAWRDERELCEWIIGKIEERVNGL